jgi:D-sedoheptulose 7-phosphate isomerase
MDITDKKLIQEHLFETSKTILDTAHKCSDSILIAATQIAESLKAGGKLILCGNGGSSSDAQHIEAEFLATLNPTNFRPGLACMALSNSTSFITAYSNDFDYKHIYSRQIEALAKQEDILLAISTSGTSKNIINALKIAQKKKMYSILLTSDKKPSNITFYDLAIIVPCDNTQHIQEAHITIGHIITRQVEIFLGY